MVSQSINREGHNYYFFFFGIKDFKLIYLENSYLKSHDTFLNGVTKPVLGFSMYLDIPANRKFSSQTSKPASDSVKPWFNNHYD